jgi:hypothetical protein
MLTMTLVEVDVRVTMLAIGLGSPAASCWKPRPSGFHGQPSSGSDQHGAEDLLLHVVPSPDTDRCGNRIANVWICTARVEQPNPRRVFRAH